MKTKVKNKKVGNSSFTGGTIFGIIITVVLSSLYIKTGRQLPFFLQPIQKIKSTANMFAASLIVDEKKLDELQREIAIQMSENPNSFIEIDDALDNFLTEEFIWTKKLKRRLMLLQKKTRMIKQTMDSGRYPSLGSSFDRVLHDIPSSTAEESYLVYNYLQRRFPGYSDQEMVEKITSMELTELLQMPKYPSAKIIFGMGQSSLVKLEIFDNDAQKVKTLMNHQLPAGKYRVYWNYTDNNETRISSSLTYKYKLLFDGHERRTQTIPIPSAVWQ